MAGCVGVLKAAAAVRGLLFTLARCLGVKGVSGIYMAVHGGLQPGYRDSQQPLQGGLAARRGQQMISSLEGSSAVARTARSSPAPLRACSSLRPAGPRVHSVVTGDLFPFQITPSPALRAARERARQIWRTKWSRARPVCPVRSTSATNLTARTPRMSPCASAWRLWTPARAAPPRSAHAARRAAPLPLLSRLCCAQSAPTGSSWPRPVSSSRRAWPGASSRYVARAAGHGAGLALRSSIAPLNAAAQTAPTHAALKLPCS